MERSNEKEEAWRGEVEKARSERDVARSVIGELQKMIAKEKEGREAVEAKLGVQEWGGIEERLRKWEEEVNKAAEAEVERLENEVGELEEKLEDAEDSWEQYEECYRHWDKVARDRAILQPSTAVKKPPQKG